MKTVRLNYHTYGSIGPARKRTSIEPSTKTETSKQHSHQPDSRARIEKTTSNSGIWRGASIKNGPKHQISA